MWCLSSRALAVIVVVVAAACLAPPVQSRLDSLKKGVSLRELNDMSLLPENTPITRFFKYSFHRLDESDVRTLAFVMKDVYAKLCVELNGCDRAEIELEDLYTRRHNELRINMYKMTKLGLLFQRLIGASSSSNKHDDDGASIIMNGSSSSSGGV